MTGDGLPRPYANAPDLPERVGDVAAMSDSTGSDVTIVCSAEGWVGAASGAPIPREQVDEQTVNLLVRHARWYRPEPRPGVT